MMRLGGVVIASLLGLIAGLWTWTRQGAEVALGEGSPVVVHILNNGFHTDLAVPRSALEARGGPLAEASRSVGAGDWILIGWGDAKFFTDTSPMEGRLLDGVRAFFRPANPSVVMLDPHAGDPVRGLPAEKVRTLSLSPAAFAAMTGRVEESLALQDGRARLSTARPGAGAHFFASHEHFWIGYLCNSWTARVLNAAGLDIRPMRAVTAGEVVATVDRAAQGA
ncbi:hypothetical protein IP78_12185 [Brevundimonas sp. AAP58]|uniref:DUF2459 domain-containing protein n=1 Tax=Brevundimonas sp. AAP58 TaxID=1523422 RepID=UPI0006B993F3|nr:DUF2459 domain-containing protein [Brevundimonas sp. AAP58]KPF77642.1 hypothetical protein IP78_12185 [Brevundimonas sp. AAP58]